MKVYLCKYKKSLLHWLGARGSFFNLSKGMRVKCDTAGATYGVLLYEGAMAFSTI